MSFLLQAELIPTVAYLRVTRSSESVELALEGIIGKNILVMTANVPFS